MNILLFNKMHGAILLPILVWIKFCKNYIISFSMNFSTKFKSSTKLCTILFCSFLISYRIEAAGNSVFHIGYSLHRFISPSHSRDLKSCSFYQKKIRFILSMPMDLIGYFKIRIELWIYGKRTYKKKGKKNSSEIFIDGTSRVVSTAEM